jgi:ankyrin repeat protein
VGLRTVKGQTPLHVAVEMAESKWLNREYNYCLSIQLLVAAGSDVNAADSSDSTPLQVRTGLCL